MMAWTDAGHACPFCGLEAAHSKNCRWLMSLEQLFRFVRDSKKAGILKPHVRICLSDLEKMHPGD